MVENDVDAGAQRRRRPGTGGGITATIETIANEIRAAAVASPEAFTERLALLWSPTVTSAHEPPNPRLDGPRPGVRQTDMHRKEDAEFRRMMPDYRLDAVAVAVEGDRIEVSARIAGTLSGNRPIALPVRWVFTLAEGRIGHSLTVVDWAVARPFVDMLNAARILPD